VYKQSVTYLCWLTELTPPLLCQVCASYYCYYRSLACYIQIMPVLCYAMCTTSSVTEFSNHFKKHQSRETNVGYLFEIVALDINQFFFQISQSRYCILNTSSHDLSCDQYIWYFISQSVQLIFHISAIDYDVVLLKCHMKPNFHSCFEYANEMGNTSFGNTKIGLWLIIHDVSEILFNKQWVKHCEVMFLWLFAKITLHRVKKRLVMHFLVKKNLVSNQCSN
jgi:hypothetical protein